MAVGTPMAAAVKIVALGGLGEIGLNLMAIECAGRAIVIDCGVMFPDEPALGMGTFIPEMGWLARSHLAVEAVVLTHAHEDHIGALPHLLRRFNVPVYGTDVTLAFTRRRLIEADFDGAADLRTIAPGQTFEAGPFTIEAIRVTHSTPNSIALAILTPAGIIVHSGDFKIDDAPVDGQLFDRERFAQLGAEGVAVLLSDSTNVERPGRSGSESSLKPVLRDLTSRARGRFFLSAFSSHLHRIRQVAEVSREFGRQIVPLGRRMAESVRLGLETGQLPFPRAMFVAPDEAEFLDHNRLSYLASGSQGEPLSALAKLAELIALTRPRWFIPIHGEYRHLSRHVALAIAAGIPEENCFLLEDGNTLVMNGAEARRGPAVEAGRVIVEGVDAGDPALVGERRILARDGTVTAIVVISGKSGRIVAGPDLVSRGLVSGDGTSTHMRRVKEELTRRLNALAGPLRANEPRVKEEIVRTIRHYFSDEMGKRPLVVPYVTEV
jgi:mRNA degradation ribonuclease J1/J2